MLQKRNMDPQLLLQHQRSGTVVDALDFYLQRLYTRKICHPVTHLFHSSSADLANQIGWLMNS